MWKYMLCLLLMIISKANIQASLIRAPSVFQPEEGNLQKYAAAVAATEPFLIQCQYQLKNSMNPLKSWFGRVISGKSLVEQAMEQRSKNNQVDQTLSKFENRMKATLESYGLSVNEFNTLTSQMASEVTLRRRILLQSYFYKIAADLEMNLKNPTSIYSSLSPQSESNSISSLHSSNQPVAMSSNLRHEPPVSSHNKPLPARVQWIKQDLNAPLNTRFARAVKHIELERINTREKIQKEFNLSNLPSFLFQPSYSRILSPMIQKCNEDYPKVAEEIVKYHGLTVDEFNSLQSKFQNNFFYRYKIKSEIQRVQ